MNSEPGPSIILETPNRNSSHASMSLSEEPEKNRTSMDSQENEISSNAILPHLLSKASRKGSIYDSRQDVSTKSRCSVGE